MQKMQQMRKMTDNYQQPGENVLQTVTFMEPSQMDQLQQQQVQQQQTHQYDPHTISDINYAPQPYAAENPYHMTYQNAGKETLTFEEILDAANYLNRFAETLPKFGIFCGSDLNGITENIENSRTLNYCQIPNFPPGQCTESEVVLGKLHGQSVIAFKGRYKYYDGYSMQQIVLPVRVMKLMGVQFIIIGNVASAINPKYNVGDIMLIKDHINFLGMSGISPLLGPNDERFGPRFPCMTCAYDKQLFALAKNICIDMGIGHIMHEGVYGGVGGPATQTTAGANALLRLNVDAVGMSTVNETLAARHAGLHVVAFSLIGAKYSLDGDYPKTFQDISQVAKARTPVCAEFVKRLVSAIGCEQNTGLGMN